jgi:hypothetical protein
LQSAIDDLLKEYGDDVRDAVKDSIKEAAKQANKELRGAGSFGGTGKYKKSWRVKIEENRLTTTATIYNSMPGLPHLLEFGHALVRGGRKIGDVKEFEHISPINDKVQEQVMKKIEEKINDI